MGIAASAEPKTTTIAASVTSPPALPIRAERQPRTAPAARTIVIASTASTEEPRNAATICGAPCIQLDMILRGGRTGLAGPCIEAQFRNGT